MFLFQKARSPSASPPWPPPAAARPGLMAPRSAWMALLPCKPRGSALGASSACSALGQASVVSRRQQNLLAHADAKQKVSAMSAEATSAHSPEQSRHSAHVTECRDCSGAGVHDPQAHSGDLLLCACANIGVTVTPSTVRWSSAVDSVSDRFHHRAGVHRTRPTHKARAALSGLSGRRHGAHGRWCRVRAPSSGRRSRVRPIFLRQYMERKCAIYSRNEPAGASHRERIECKD